MSTQEIKDIYKKAQVLKFDASKRLREKMNDSLEGQLTRVFKNYFELLKDPKIAVGLQDQMKCEMTKTLDIIVMDSDHDVIMALTNNLIEKKYKEKIKND